MAGLVNNIGFQCFQHGVQFFFCVNIQINRLGQIQTEDAHNGSKSTSNFVMSFTKDFTFSMEFKHIFTVFMVNTSLDYELTLILIRRGVKVNEKRKIFYMIWQEAEK